MYVILTQKQTPYCAKYRRVFADAFDVYLDIIRTVEKRVKVALGQDSPDWRVLNACPACSYEVRYAPLVVPPSLTTSIA
jgi:hypothetical protein